MSITTADVDGALETLPADLESPRAKLVYLTLSFSGTASLAELHEVLDVPKLTLLSVLDALTVQELVEWTDDGYAVLA